MLREVLGSLCHRCGRKPPHGSLARRSIKSQAKLASNARAASASSYTF